MIMTLTLTLKVIRNRERVLLSLPFSSPVVGRRTQLRSGILVVCLSLFSALWAGFPDQLLAQTPPITYPRDVDIGVAGITLSFRQNAEEVLGAQLVLVDRDTRSSVLVCRNAAATEELELVHHRGRAQHTFQEFRVRQRSADRAAADTPVKAERSTEGSSSMSNGAEGDPSAAELEDVQAGDPEQPKECVLDLPHFESNRGVHLGMSLSRLTAVFGDRFRVDTQGDLTVLTYSIESNLSSAFLKYYDALSYYGRYYFRRGRLVEFSFGLDNL